MKHVEKKLEHEVNISKKHPLKEFITYFSGVLFVLLLVFFLLGIFVDIFIESLPRKHLTSLNSLLSKTGPGVSLTIRTTEELKIQAILNKILVNTSMSDQNFTVLIRPGKNINAIAYPANIIVLHRPTITAAKTDNEIARVLGHELGHYYNNDHLKGMGRAIIFLGFSVIALGQNSSVTSFLKNTLESVNLKFNRRQEEQADSYGLDLLNKAYGHVEEADSFYKKMKNEYGSSSWLTSYMSTHPAIENRIKKIKTMAVTRGYSLNGKLIKL
jgi:Zn-dependent protease with chaperone function